MPKNSIGVLGGGKHKLTDNIDIAMIQSLSRKDEVSDVITQYAQVIIDECHHLSAFSFEKVLKKTNAKYVLGLTATPIRKDGHHPIIMMQCGPIRYRSNNKNNKDTRSHIVYCRETNFIQTKQDSTMAELYGELSINETRNNQIFNDVVTALENKRKPILLTERTQHLDWFKEKFSKFVKNIFVLQGGMKSKESMSEYQYYEFCSINKPLTSEARKEMHLLSSRANVGTHNASYVYNFGDFRGNSDKLLLKYFDVFFYISNFGTIRLTFKYNVSQINIDEIKKYCVEDVVEYEQYGQDILLDISLQNEDGFGWTEGEGVLADLLPLYDEIKSKNYQFLRIVSAVNDEWTGTIDEALKALLSETKLFSQAQHAFLENAGVEKVY